jgi:ABC-type transporter Mla maintaining outer membrane lipid asymmetry ATPase subunit MlaF
MMFGPEPILPDEPFGGIKPALVERLAAIVLRLNRAPGKTCFRISPRCPP